MEGFSCLYLGTTMQKHSQLLEYYWRIASMFLDDCCTSREQVPTPLRAFKGQLIFENPPRHPRIVHRSSFTSFSLPMYALALSLTVASSFRRASAWFKKVGRRRLFRKSVNLSSFPGRFHIIASM